MSLITSTERPLTPLRCYGTVVGVESLKLSESERIDSVFHDQSLRGHFLDFEAPRGVHAKVV